MTRELICEKLNEMAVLISEKGVTPPFLYEEINKLSIYVLGREVKKCNCGDKYSDAVFEMLNFLKSDKIMRAEITCKLKSGVLIQFENKVYTNENITDEVATKFLKMYPSKDNLFHVKPKAEKKPIRKKNKQS